MTGKQAHWQIELPAHCGCANFNMTVTVTPYITRKGLIVRAPRPDTGYLSIEGSQRGLGVAVGQH